MQKNDWQRIETLFGEALALPEAQREAFLHDSCGGDTHIFQEVRQLLAQHEAGEDFFSQLGQDLQSGWQEAAPLAPGDRLGAYEVEAEIGRGGMAVVYRADRVDGAYQEKVAIKVLKKGLDTAAILRRFRYEQQLLVDLRHPGIANLLDAGETSAGQPFLMMEYIDGQPLDQYLAKHEPDLKARLRLFLQIAAAVQHAHQQLVVHRDLKPSNILVNAQGQIKLLDFGIAKLLAEHPGAGQTLTQAEQRLLTPRYAAPEQREGGSISTATDVYQLGLILGEMLGLHASTGGDTPAPPKDLTAIVGMACREEPSRRYRSADELGREVENFLADRPVQARPESWGYLARKFIRRNRLAVAAATLILLTLTGGVVATAWQARKAQQALQQETEQREKAEAVSDFLLYLFARVDPYRNEDTVAVKDLTIEQFLALSMDEVRGDYLDEPELRMELFDILRDLYYNLNLRQEGYEVGLEVLQITEALRGRDDPDYASRVHNLAGVSMDLGRLAEADSLFRLALPATRAAYGLQPKHLAVVYNDYGILKSYQEDYAGADSLYEEALRIMRINQIADTANYAQTLGNQSDMKRALGDLPGAYRNCREALRVLKMAGYEGTIFMAHAQNWMGKAFLKMDSLPQAAEYLKQARLGFEHHLGSVSHFVFLTMAWEALICFEREQYPRQLALLDSAKNIVVELYGTTELYNYHNCQLQQARGLIKLGQADQARALLLESLAFYRRAGFEQKVAQAEALLAEA